MPLPLMDGVAFVFSKLLRQRIVLLQGPSIGLQNLNLSVLSITVPTQFFRIYFSRKATDYPPVALTLFLKRKCLTIYLQILVPIAFYSGEGCMTNI